jgi:hypothetical protein
MGGEASKSKSKSDDDDGVDVFKFESCGVNTLLRTVTVPGDVWTDGDKNDPQSCIKLRASPKYNVNQNYNADGCGFVDITLTWPGTGTKDMYRLTFKEMIVTRGFVVMRYDGLAMRVRIRDPDGIDLEKLWVKGEWTVPDHVSQGPFVVKYDDQGVLPQSPKDPVLIVDEGILLQAGENEGAIVKALHFKEFGVTESGEIRLEYPGTTTALAVRNCFISQSSG